MKPKIFYTEKSEFFDNSLPERTMLVKHLQSFGYYVDSCILHGDDTVMDGNADAFEVLSRIIECDIFIGEMSVSSQTLGFQLAYAVLHNKPSLYLYNKSTLGKPKSPLYGNPSRLISIKDYTDQNYKEVLNKFLKKAEKQLLSDRITFVATHRIDEYLNQKSNASGLSKGEIIRTIIEDQIDKEDL